MQPPFKCLFCGTVQGPFQRVEHPVPESMGNDDTFLPKGFVCDQCNQYFGSKIEREVMMSPPFNLERVMSSTKTKNHGYAKYRDKSLLLQSAGYWNRVLFAATPNRFQELMGRDNGVLWVEPPINYVVLLARFLTKMGLELLLLTEEVDPYSPVFDKARSCARYGAGVISWEVAYGHYPKSEDFIVSTRMDEFGPLETRQVYQFEMGRMASGDYHLCFVYSSHCYSVNLSGPSLREYVSKFNDLNNFEMKIGSGLMDPRNRKR